MISAPTEHATAVAIGGRGVLIRGAPGSGKSSLALSLLQDCAEACLVGDDRVILAREGGAVIASPPPELAGLLEARGLGILRLPFRSAPLALVVDLVPEAECPRLPGPAEQSAIIAGAELPRFFVPVGSAAATARIKAALELLRPGADCLLHSGVDWTKLCSREMTGGHLRSER